MKFFKKAFGKKDAEPLKAPVVVAAVAPPPGTPAAPGSGGAKGGGKGAGKNGAGFEVPAASAPALSPARPGRCRPVHEDSLDLLIPRGCNNVCGWTAFKGFSACCRLCTSSDGPHAKDCASKNTRWPPPCERGCGRPAFGTFATCCTRCQGPEGPHSRNCARKNGIEEPPAMLPAAAVIAGPDDVLEELRAKLVEWQKMPGSITRAQVDEVIRELAATSGMEREAVRMLWLTAARQARPVGAPVDAYLSLAKNHHGVDVEVIDLGGTSAKCSNSCMFLTCSVALAHRRAQALEDGRDDALPPGPLGEALAAAAPDTNSAASTSIDDLIEQHRRTRHGTLGRMADALRAAACDMLTSEEDSFRPYYTPVRGAGFGDEAESRSAYRRWVGKMRQDEEGDELVMLCLSNLLGMPVQPVQQSGYRVPLMDPKEMASEPGAVSYWGNDDKHWVWLRPLSAEGAAAKAAAPYPAAAPAADSTTAPAREGPQSLADLNAVLCGLEQRFGVASALAPAEARTCLAQVEADVHSLEKALDSTSLAALAELEVRSGREPASEEALRAERKRLLAATEGLLNRIEAYFKAAAPLPTESDAASFVDGSEFPSGLF